MSTNTAYDVIVIGGGPAGMMAAGRASERGLRVLLLEKNSVLGKKLSITGGGRCNITNAEFDHRVLLKHYGKAEQFLYAPFSQFGVKDTIEFFESRTLPLKIEDRKRAFPKTERATDVTRVMEHFMIQNGVEVRSNTRVTGFDVGNGVVSGVITDVGVFHARKFIIASGGVSHAETGSTGEGLSWLQSLGHITHTPNPNIVPLVVSDTWIKKLSGTTLSSVRITFTQGKVKFKKDGDILCTHFGLSGPLILNSAYQVKTMLKEGSVTATIDLFPKEDVGQLRTRFQELSLKHPNKTLMNALKDWFPKALVEIIASCSEGVGDTKMHSLPREARHMIVDRIKCLSLTVTATMGYDWAVVSDGGVDLTEIETKTMQSKIHRNLYLVGDILHINRPSGGYSLQLCWTTGYVAGNSV